MKGIILAGGSGTRLYPLTQCINKHLIPIYDKPMIYYPLSTLMLAGIRDILIITTSHALPSFQTLFKDGKHLGLNIEYAIQDQPKGISDAFVIGEKFIGDDNVCLILGDNVFYGAGITGMLLEAIEQHEHATIFGYRVGDPQRFGVVEFAKDGTVTSIEEKPQNPRSNFAIPGLYFYENSVVDIAKETTPSARGELEITDINNIYLNQKKLKVQLFGRGIAWLDTGTYDALIDASHFVQVLEKRQFLKIGCIEEIAWRKNYINTDQLQKLADSQHKSTYGAYLQQLLQEI